MTKESDNNSVADIGAQFMNESSDFESAIRNIGDKFDSLSLVDMFTHYYKVMITSARSKAAKQSGAAVGKVGKRVALVEEQILEFNTRIHPAMFSYIKESEKRQVEALRATRNGSGREKLFKKLKQTMSMRNFIEQYDKGLES